MSLHAAAQHLAAQGRGDDKVLVHMTPGEVRSLQDLAKAHGGSLTINPKTGLAEAGFLSSVLPMAAGAGLMMIPGMQPLGAAALVGGLGYLASGNLKTGLMAGLGAYGGAGLGAGFANMGASSETAGNMLQEGLNTAGIEMTPAEYNALSSTDKAAIFQKPGAWADPFATGTPPPIQDVQKQQLFSQGMAEAAKTPVAPSYDTFKTGISEAVNNPSNVPAAFGGAGKLAGYGAAALAEPISSALQPRGLQMPEMKASAPNPVYRYDPGMATPTPAADPFGVERNYFPTAGYTRLAADGGMMYGAGGGVDRNLQTVPTYEPVVKMGTGGISDLGSYSDGGRLLRGPGDGVSDSIPAVIGRKQPARLADGEFVVPARIVSEIGNGSTEAGARKLYAMMDRVQQARGKTVGKGKVAKNTRADKYLPA